MKPLRSRPEQKTTADVARLAHALEEQIGEDNAIPWLLVHNELVQNAVGGYRIDVQDAVRRAQQYRN